jgi:hypothetical protein
MKQIQKRIPLLLILLPLISCSAPKQNQPATATPPPPSTATPEPSRTPSRTPTVTPTPTPACPSTSTAPPDITLELYGNFHAMGVIVEVGDHHPEGNAVAQVEYRAGSGAFRQGFPLSRVSEARFVGSLFWLEPGTSYDVRVTFIEEGGALHCSSITSSGSTRTELTALDPVNTYVVSSDGSGSACSMESPCTLTTGINRARAGDSVILHGGVYHQGNIGLPHSGSPEAPIVIQSSPGERAILDGSDPEKFTWESRGDGIFETTVNASEPTLVMADGVRLYRYQSYEDLQNLTWDLPGFFAQGYRVYVHLTDDADPNDHEMAVGRRMYAFWVDRDYIHIKDLTFRYYEVRWQRSALYIYNGSHNLIQGCTFALNGYGVILQGASHRNVIEGSKFYDAIYAWPWDAVKALHDNTGQGMETGGIRISDPHPRDPVVMPRGTVVRGNSFHDYFDGFGVCTFETPAEPSNETDIYENHIYRIGDDGMEADGYCSNVRIWGNTFEDVLVGVSLAPAQVGPTYMVRNLIHNIGRSGGCPFGWEGPCGGTALKVQFGEPVAGPMFLFHNTMDSGSRHVTAYIAEDATWPLLVSRNNNWGSSRSGGLSVEVDDPVDFDYDNIVSRPGSLLVHWRGTDFDTLEALTRATGQEAHGLSVDPRFVDVAAREYTLLADSPLIDSGEFIPGVNDGYLGAGPDIGAYEFGTH